MSTRNLASLARGAAAALLLAGCLPGDTRPPPAVIHFTVEPSPAVTAGVTTEDGWHIVFEKLLVSLGGAGVDNDGAGCTRYANGGYERLFDFTVPGQQKLSDVYALGTCDLRFSLRSPGSDTLLGKGVTAADLAFMRIEDQDSAGVTGRKTVHVRGRATREAVTKSFEWSFRVNVRLRHCAGPGGVGVASRVDLHGGQDLPLSIIVHGEELFRERADDESPLRFDVFASADADGDQVITLDELYNLPSPAHDVDGGLGLSPDAGPAPFTMFLYYLILPRMARLGDSGACLPESQ
jgi:hypothetical protein